MSCSPRSCAITPDADQMPAVTVRIWDVQDVRNLAHMCDAMHAHGALAGIELKHGGGLAQNAESRYHARGRRPGAERRAPSGHAAWHDEA